MPSKIRTFTFRDRIKMSSADLELLRRGRKKCTIRLGLADVTKPHLLATDGTATVPVEVTSVIKDRSLQDLTDLDAQDEGFESLSELLDDLRRYYPNAPPERSHHCHLPSRPH